MTIPGSRPQTTTQTADAAGRWDARLRAPDCTAAERADFAAWCNADPLHRAAFEQLQTIVATLRHDRSRADVRALRDEALRVTGTHRRRRMAWVAAVAGVAVLGVSLTVRFAGAEIYATGTAERSTFTLADGSTVELNAQSRIQVHYSESRRRVELIKGQVLFNVAKNVNRPFIVRAGNRNIVAIGTQFDVRLDAGSVQVTLIEGKVRIEQQAAQPKDAILLTPGKQLLARSGRDTSIRNIDVAKVAGWHDGRIFLDDLPLTEAVAEMNKHSAVQITVDDPELAQWRVSGMFKAGEQETFVTALEDYFPIAVQHRGSQEIGLTARRPE